MTRWLAIAIFILSTTLNYLDRQLLSAVAPALRAEFHLNNEQLGLVVTGFSLAYALTAPFAGLFIDRIGLNRGITLAVAGWSLAGICTGIVSSLTGFVTTRTALGAAEAAGIPAFAKANATYLRSDELALGTAANQIGIALAGVTAPLIVGFFMLHYGWRALFVACGALGFVWIPLWWIIARRFPAPARAAHAKQQDLAAMLRDRRFWGLIAANLLYMTLYSLWTNWLTVYFVDARHLTPADANRMFAWIPPIFGTLGGFAGGAMAFRLIRSGLPVFPARMRICFLSAILVLATAAVPLMPTATAATIAISFSFFWITAMSTNIYVMPIDFFGAGRAAFGVAALTAAYGLMQSFVSPVIGRTIDQFGFNRVCTVLAPLPLIACFILQGLCHDDQNRNTR